MIKDFLNTIDRREGRDAFSSIGRTQEWLVDRLLVAAGTTVTGRDYLGLLTLRDELRELLRAGSDGSGGSDGDGGGPQETIAALDATLAGYPLTVSFASGVPRIVGVPGGGVADAVARLVDAVRDAVADGTWERLKVCRRAGCDLVLWDRSRNRSGRWCSMARCGNQLKGQRAYEARVWPTAYPGQ